MESELVDLLCAVINQPSPTGYEQDVGGLLATWLNQRGRAAGKQEIDETRANVVGRLNGTGGGKSVAFNSHMDTTFVGTDEDDLPILGRVENIARPSAEVRDGIVYGLGAFNDK